MDWPSELDLKEHICPVAPRPVAGVVDSTRVDGRPRLHESWWRQASQLLPPFCWHWWWWWCSQWRWWNCRLQRQTAATTSLKPPHYQQSMMKTLTPKTNSNLFWENRGYVYIRKEKFFSTKIFTNNFTESFAKILTSILDQRCHIYF